MAKSDQGWTLPPCPWETFRWPPLDGTESSDREVAAWLGGTPVAPVDGVNGNGEGMA